MDNDRMSFALRMRTSMIHARYTTYSQLLLALHYYTTNLRRIRPSISLLELPMCA